MFGDIEILKREGRNKLAIFIIIIFILFCSILFMNHFNEFNKYIHILPTIKKYSKYPILKKIFKSKIIYINDVNITNEYILFLSKNTLEKEMNHIKKGNGL